MLAVIIAIVALGLLLALALSFKRRRGDAPAGVVDLTEASGPYYGGLPRSEPHSPGDYIGEEPDDLGPKDAGAEAKLWQHERELYQEKDQES